MTVRIGVIGCGAIAQEGHLPGYAACADVEIAAVCDVDPQRARAVAERFGVKDVYTSHVELLADKSIQAVSICTPNFLHATHAIDSLQAGKAVLCEKPMTTTRGDAQAVLNAAEQTGSMLMVGFTHRFFLHNRYVRSLIQSGAIGEVLSVRVRMAHRGPYESWVAKSDWFFRHEMAGGGAVLDMGIHALDIMRFFAGEIAEIKGLTATKVHPLKDEDMAVAIMRFASGALGYLETGWHSHPGFNGIEIYASQGTIINDYGTGLRLLDAAGKEQALDRAALEGLTGHMLEVRHFVDCVKGGQRPEVGGVDGYKAIDLALGIYGR